MSDMRLLAALAAFLTTIPVANWLIGNVGTKCIPNGPCLIPVWPDLLAPSGVLVIGIALVLRDYIHERGGSAVAFAAIVVGAALSAMVAPWSLVIASGVAFLLSEIADLAVYAPLRERRLYLAVLLSGAVGALVDSAIFLLIAFGSLDFVIGNTVGKFWASCAALPLIALRRRWA